MTEYEIKTTLNEADDIFSGKKLFIFRDTKYKFGINDRIRFRVFKNERETRHPINNCKYIVTYVSKEAPIEKGFCIVGIR